ncbi:hypothetical protein BS47DRAFT_1346878 [Hydnum rufescens UP504]|uniref:Uncharacterized protein n=1 Tax=Hydnum rufescens UP504 TaxID=1448309 RepID=A0A9P6DU69_9AGAM|nr:hypothetical protein BS47DRAFT_1346878 [Hydnum rufescens UP504]
MSSPSLSSRSFDRITYKSRRTKRTLLESSPSTSPPPTRKKFKVFSTDSVEYGESRLVKAGSTVTKHPNTLKTSSMNQSFSKNAMLAVSSPFMLSPLKSSPISSPRKSTRTMSSHLSQNEQLPLASPFKVVSRPISSRILSTKQPSSSRDRYISRGSVRHASIDSRQRNAATSTRSYRRQASSISTVGRTRESSWLMAPNQSSTREIHDSKKDTGILSLKIQKRRTSPPLASEDTSFVMSEMPSFLSIQGFSTPPRDPGKTVVAHLDDIEHTEKQRYWASDPSDGISILDNNVIFSGPASKPTTPPPTSTHHSVIDCRNSSDMITLTDDWPDIEASSPFAMTTSPRHSYAVRATNQDLDTDSSGPGSDSENNMQTPTSDTLSSVSMRRNAVGLEEAVDASLAYILSSFDIDDSPTAQQIHMTKEGYSIASSFPRASVSRHSTSPVVSSSLSPPSGHDRARRSPTLSMENDPFNIRTNENSGNRHVERKIAPQNTERVKGITASRLVGTKDLGTSTARQNTKSTKHNKGLSGSYRAPRDRGAGRSDAIVPVSHHNASKAKHRYGLSFSPGREIGKSRTDDSESEDELLLVRGQTKSPSNTSHPDSKWILGVVYPTILAAILTTNED